jgi:hypothetical protein
VTTTEPDADADVDAGPDVDVDAVKPARTIRSGRELDKLAELEEERRYLLRSLKDLEREHEAGDVDDDDYRTLKAGYTVRAATVLRQIETGRRHLAPKKKRNWGRSIAIVFAVLACAAGAGFALASAFGERADDQEFTGASPADLLRTKLVDARAALNRGDFVQANRLFVEVDQDELVRGNDNAEARTYVGWTFALIARSDSETVGLEDDRIALSLLALNQAIGIDPTYADPYCFVAIIEFNFRASAEAALPFVEQCEGLNPPADIAGLVSGFAEEIRTAVAAAQ